MNPTLIHAARLTMIVTLGGLWLSTAGCSSDALSARNAGPVAGKPAAIAGGEPITWDQIRPIVAEASGRQAIDEIALDRELTKELATAGVRIGDAETRRERELLSQTLGDGGDAAVRTLREERGLGPTRFAAMLWRSAALRALTGGESVLQAQEVERELDMRYGAAWRVRLVVVRTAREAQDALTQIAASADRAAAIAAIARERSIDPSSADGGLKPRLSTLDPSLPVALRQWLGTAKPGELSGIIALDRGFAIAMPEEALAPRTPTDEERSRVTTALTLGKQRLAMDRLAKSLLDRARVTVLDQSAGWRSADRGQ